MQEQHLGLTIQNLQFSFSKDKPSLFKSVDLFCKAGQLHFIQGKNGSGKTTLLRILKGAVASSECVSGSVHLDGFSYNLEDSTQRALYAQQVKSVVQNVNSMVVEQCTVQENLRFACLPEYPGLHQLSHEQYLSSILQESGIALNSLVSKLSGGQRQIVAMVMMLQKKTQLLLLDEPTSALDPQNAHLVIQSLEKLARNLMIPILIISHDKEMILTYLNHDYIEIAVGPDGNRTIKKVTITKHSKE